MNDEMQIYSVGDDIKKFFLPSRRKRLVESSEKSVLNGLQMFFNAEQFDLCFELFLDGMEYGCVCVCGDIMTLSDMIDALVVKCH